MCKAIFMGDHGRDSYEVPLSQVRIQGNGPLAKGERVFVTPSFRMILNFQRSPTGDMEVTYENCFIICAFRRKRTRFRRKAITGIRHPGSSERFE
jgi:hypothetical protein